MTEGLPKTTWTTGDLLERLERCERFFVLDVRNRDEFERFRIEGREPLPAVNVPYFEMLELGGKDEMVDSVAAYVEQHMADQLPHLPRFIPEYVDIKRVNAGLLAAEDDAASTLETGKNVCALSQAYKDSSGETT